MGTLWLDIRLALRNLRLRPGFCAAIILVLAIGLGGSTAIFALMKNLFLTPLSVKEPDRLVSLYRTFKSTAGDYSGFYNFSYLNYLDFRDRTRSFASLGLYQWFPMTLSEGLEARRVTGMYVTHNYFELLGVPPHQGRFFLSEEDRDGGSPAIAVLSHASWQRLFGGDPEVIGKPIAVNGARLRVAGVAPEGFNGTEINITVDVWLPIMLFKQLSPHAGFFDLRDGLVFRSIGRLQNGVAISAARSEIESISARLEEQFPKENEDLGTLLLPLIDTAVVPQTRARFLGYGRALTLGAVLLLVIACVNVASLLILRGMERRRELALCQAVGANRRALVRRLLAESLLLFSLGGLLSLATAHLSLRALWNLRPPGFAPHRPVPEIDLGVLAFSSLTVLACGLVVGLVFALRATQFDVVSSLKGIQRTTSSILRQWQPTDQLVVTQLAIALVALVAASLFIQGLRHSQTMDLGFDPDQLIVMTLNPGDLGYDQDRIRAFFDLALEKAQSIPGVQSATLSENRLLRGSVVTREVYLESQQESVEGGGRSSHRLNVVVPGFFRTVGIELLRGRDFDASDCSDCTRVAIVNETMASQIWPGENPVGRRIRFNSPTDPPMEIVGVVEDSKYREIHERPQFFIYLPLAQNTVSGMTLHARVAGNLTTTIGSMRREIGSLDPNLPLVEPGSMDEFVDQALWSERLPALMLFIFGCLSILLATAGIYSVASYSTALRQREVTIRMALGADTRRIFGMLLRDSARLVAAGLLIGWIAAYFILTPTISSQLHGVGTFDPVGYLLGSAVLLVAAILGCLAPALRSSKSSPSSLIRGD